MDYKVIVDEVEWNYNLKEFLLGGNTVIWLNTFPFSKVTVNDFTMAKDFFNFISQIFPKKLLKGRTITLVRKGKIRIEYSFRLVSSTSPEIPTLLGKIFMLRSSSNIRLPSWINAERLLIDSEGNSSAFILNVSLGKIVGILGYKNKTHAELIGNIISSNLDPNVMEPSLDPNELRIQILINNGFYSEAVAVIRRELENIFLDFFKPYCIQLSFTSNPADNEIKKIINAFMSICNNIKNNYSPYIYDIIILFSNVKILYSLGKQFSEIADKVFQVFGPDFLSKLVSINVMRTLGNLAVHYGGLNKEEALAAYSLYLLVKRTMRFH